MKTGNDEDEDTSKAVDPDADEDFSNAATVDSADTEAATADLDDNSPQNAKKRKLESGEALPTDSSTVVEDVIVINSNDVDLDEAALKDAITDNLDINGVEVAPTGDWGGGWGSGEPSISATYYLTVMEEWDDGSVSNFFGTLP